MHTCPFVLSIPNCCSFIYPFISQLVMLSFYPSLISSFLYSSLLCFPHGTLLSFSLHSQSVFIFTNCLPISISTLPSSFFFLGCFSTFCLFFAVTAFVLVLFFQFFVLMIILSLPLEALPSHFVLKNLYFILVASFLPVLRRLESIWPVSFHLRGSHQILRVPNRAVQIRS